MTNNLFCAGTQILLCRKPQNVFNMPWSCYSEDGSNRPTQLRNICSNRPVCTVSGYKHCLSLAYSTEQRPSGLQLVKKFPTFYGTRRFITAFRSARHLSLSWARSIQYIPPHPTSWRSILILSYHLRFLCEHFVMRHFYGGELSAPHPTTKLEDHPLCAVRDCLFNIFAAALNIIGRSSIRNLRMRHAVVTGTDLSHGHMKRWFSKATY